MVIAGGNGRSPLGIKPRQLPVERLLAQSPEAIRTLRGQDPDWRAVTPARLRAVAPALTDEQAALLCERCEMRPDTEGDIARTMMTAAGR